MTASPTVQEDVRATGRRWRGLAATIGLGLVALMAWLVITTPVSPDQRAAQAAPPAPGEVVVQVERRMLSTSVVVRGTVSALDQHDVSYRGEGTIVTGTPLRVDDEAIEGDVLIEVSGRPIVAIEGMTPSYRDLHLGLSGRDVMQLQDALTRLGYAISEDERSNFGGTTALAVEAFYRDRGYEPARVVGVDPGVLSEEVGAAQEALDQALARRAAAGEGPSQDEILRADVDLADAEDHLARTQAEQDIVVSRAEASHDSYESELEQARDDGADPAVIEALEDSVALASQELELARMTRDQRIAAASRSLSLAQAARDALDQPADLTLHDAEVAAARSRLDDARRAAEAVEGANGVRVPASALVVVPILPARIASLDAAIGDPVGERLLSLSSMNLSVEAQLSESAHALVDEGSPVEFRSEVLGASASGRVRVLHAEAEDGFSSSGSGRRVIVEPDEPLGSEWLGRSVQVSILDAERVEESLVVPEAAIFTRPDGSTHVARMNDPGVPSEHVQVEVVDSVGGFVALEGEPLTEGDFVVVSEENLGDQPRPEG